MINKIIKTVGTEIECGIDESDLSEFLHNLNENNLTNFYSYCNDMSVRVYSKDITDFEFQFWHYNLETFKNVLKEFFKRITTNKTCGTHFHLRIHEEVLGKFTYNSFIYYFLKQYLKTFCKTICEKYNYETLIHDLMNFKTTSVFHFFDKVRYDKEIKQKEMKYFNRLLNRYCETFLNENYILNILNKSNTNRYKAINFVSLFEKQKTLEIRIMPNCACFKEFEEQLHFIIDVFTNFFENEKVKYEKEIELTDEKNETIEKEMKIEIEKLIKKKFKIKIEKIKLEVM